MILNVNKKAPSLSTPPPYQNSLLKGNFQDSFSSSIFCQSRGKFPLLFPWLLRWCQQRHEKNVCAGACHLVLFGTPVPSLQQPKSDSGGRHTVLTLSYSPTPWLKSLIHEQGHSRTSTPAQPALTKRTDQQPTESQGIINVCCFKSLSLGIIFMARKYWLMLITVKSIISLALFCGLYSGVKEEKYNITGFRCLDPRPNTTTRSIHLQLWAKLMGENIG